MYHCFDISLPSMFLCIFNQPANRLAENGVGQEKVDPKERHGDSDDDGRRDHVVARRPVHLLHFDAHIMQKQPQAPWICGELSYRLHQGECVYAAICFVFIQFRRLCHLAGRLCTVEFNSSRPPAPTAKRLAGEEGFEPPHPVLETGGLPLNLLPFTLSPLPSGRRVKLKGQTQSNSSSKLRNQLQLLLSPPPLQFLLPLP